jgi:hypothetical protein
MSSNELIRGNTGLKRLVLGAVGAVSLFALHGCVFVSGGDWGGGHHGGGHHGGGWGGRGRCEVMPNSTILEVMPEATTAKKSPAGGVG